MTARRCSPNLVLKNLPVFPMQNNMPNFDYFFIHPVKASLLCLHKSNHYYSRYLYCRRSLNGQKVLDVKKYGELMKEMDKKLEEVKANQQRMEDNMKNLKQEIIDEIRGSVSNISYMHAKELL